MEESETNFEKWKQENKVNFDNFVYCCLHTVHKGVIEAHFKTMFEKGYEQGLKDKI